MKYLMLILMIVCFSLTLNGMDCENTGDDSKKNERKLVQRKPNKTKQKPSITYINNNKSGNTYHSSGSPIINNNPHFSNLTMKRKDTSITSSDSSPYLDAAVISSGLCCCAAIIYKLCTGKEAPIQQQKQ